MTGTEIEAGEPRLYRVRTEHMAALEAKVATINRRVVRKGLEHPIVLTRVGTEMVEVTETREDGSTEVIGEYEVTLVTVNAERPKYNGWTLAATLQHEEGANILRVVPGADTLPEAYRTTTAVCDQCHTARRRIDTYVVLHEDGRYAQVGRNCLRDFLGHVNGEHIAAWFDYLAQVEALAEGEERDGGGGGGGGAFEFLASAYLPYVACSIRERGWVSRGVAREFSKEASADDAMYSFKPPAVRDRDKTRPLLRPTDADRQRTDAALAWVASLTDADLRGNDYLWNLRTACAKRTVTGRETGIIASVFAAHDKAMQRETERVLRATRNHLSEWVGTLGERLTLTLTVVGTRDIVGDFGGCTLYTFEDEAGHEFKWFASRGLDTTDYSAPLTVKATISRHDTYNDHKQTVLSRVKEIAS